MLILTVFVACGSRRAAVPPTSVPAELSFQQRAQRDLDALASAKPAAATGIDALDPAVRDALKKQAWYQEEAPAESQLLTQFLLEASENIVGARPEWPYASRVENDRVVNVPFGVDRELKIIDHRLFDFIGPAESQIIVVFSSDDFDLQRQQIQPILDRVKFYLPEIESFVGHAYVSNYLHIQLRKPGGPSDPSYERGSNVFLDYPGSPGPAFDTLLVHELTHSYSTLLPRDAHPWLTEGIAELVALVLTGRSTGYAFSASYEPLPVELFGGRASVFTKDYQAESGDGALFFSELLSVLGRERMSAVVEAIHASILHREADLFDIIRANTPPEQAEKVEKILDKWLNGTNLARPAR